MKQGNIDMSAQTMSRDIHIHRKTAAPHTKHQKKKNIYIYIYIISSNNFQLRVEQGITIMKKNIPFCTLSKANRKKRAINQPSRSLFKQDSNKCVNLKCTFN
jgi:hypothetical protein